MARRRLTRIIGLLVLALLSTMVVLVSPAQAATGVFGRLDTASLTAGSYSCYPEQPQYCQSYSAVRVTGWALNLKTAPVQEAYIFISGTVRVDSNGAHVHNYYFSKTFVANTYRPDVQRAYHLSSPYVGFSTTFNTTAGSYFIGTVSVCVSARDHGSSQAWIQISCRSVVAH
ncbi:MAG: hypothetical protein M3042_05980 [Actinomycetota bacterium]|nr:hypothetical protein [Actinomycetota bacterium]